MDQMKQLDLIQLDEHLILEKILQDRSGFDNLKPMAALDDIDLLLGSKRPLQELKKEIMQEDLLIENLFLQQKDQFDNEKFTDLLKDFQKEEQESNQQIIEMPQYIIDYVDSFEKQPYLTQQTNSQESELLQPYELLKLQINSFQEKKMSKNQRQLFDQISLKQGDSRFKCLTISKEGLIAIGTSKASIILLSDKIIKLEQDPSILICPVICIRFSGCYLIVITQKQILLYCKQKLEKVFSKLFEGIPLSVVEYESKLFISNLVLCDSNGLVQILSIRKGTFSYGIQNTPLFKGSFGVCHEMDITTIKNLKFVAMAFKSSVFVVVVDPFVELVFKKPIEIKNDQQQNNNRYLPQAKWQLNCLTPLLIIGWMNQIEIISIECKSQENGVFTKYNIIQNRFQILDVYNFEMKDKIETMQFLSDDALFIKFDRKKYNLISLKNLKSDPIIQQGLLVSNISQQTYNVDNISQYHNTITFLNGNIYYIEEQQDKQNQYIINYQLLNYLNYIQQLINNLAWNDCLTICISIYQGKNNKFIGIPDKNQLRIIFNEKLKQYVEKMIECKQIENVISIAIDFLCNIESYTFLFQDIFNIFKRNRLEKEFLNKLEVFILRNQIKFIPNEPLKAIMQNFKDQRKLCTLKQLIINLDIQQLDSIVVQQLCIEFNLFTPLIYISPRVDDDYKTPLFKMFAVYQQLLLDYKQYGNSKQDNSVVKYFEDLQIDMPDTNEKILKEIKLQGYRCIWYMTLCFQGDLFPDAKIPTKVWPKIVTELLSWFLYEDTIAQFFLIDIPVTLNQLILLFKPSLYNQIDTNILGIGDQNLSEYVIQQIEKNPNPFLGLFIYEIMELGYPVTYNQFKIAIQDCFLHPDTSLKCKALDSSIIYFGGEPTNLNQVPRKEDKENVIIKYLNEFRDSSIKSTQDISDLISASHENNFLRVLAELQFFQEKYQLAIVAVLSSADYSKFVFDYIRRSMSALKADNNKQLLEYILGIVPKLVSINAEKLIKVLNYYGEEDYQIAIEMLDSHPELKLTLLSEIICQKRQNKILVDDKLMISFFKLICVYHKTQVYEQLQFGDFPQDECLKICQKYNIQIGIAYLTERSGKYGEALDLYFDIVLQDLKQIMQTQSNAKNDPQFLFEWIQMQIHPCIHICRSSHVDEEEQMQFWFQCVIRMVNLRQEFEEYEIVYVCLNRVYQIMLEEVLERVPLQAVIQNLKLLLGSFTRMEELRRTFTKLLSNCSYELNNERHSMKIQEQGIYCLLEQVYKLKCKGSCFHPVCNTCQEGKNQNMICFLDCSHNYHVGCIGKNIDIVCEDCYNSNVIYRLKKQIQFALDKGQQKQQAGEEIINMKSKYQNPQQEIEEWSKEELRSLKINKWKMLDIDKYQNQMDIDEILLL